jgi:serine phosphatase RsbU (regulator of sigma subunit)
MLISGSRLRREPLQVLATAFDLSERKAVEREIAALLERERDARFAAELAGARTSRLQEITSGLSATNSPTGIARTVVHHALEELSASAGLLVRTDGEPRIVRAVGFPPDDVAAWGQWPATLPRALRAASTGGGPVTEGDPAAGAAGVEDLPEAATAIAVALEAGGAVLGALLLAFREPRAIAAEDREFLVSLASQAAAALQRAELYEDRAYVARTLQEGLLPRTLPEIPGAEAAVVYESISGRGQVGGDFYDLFDTGLGGWALAVGDVSGKGTAAAVITGLARHTVRAIARVHDDPDEILGFLNGALRRHEGPPAFCTVACAVIEPHPAGGFIARVSSGGHPYPLVLRRGGALEPLEVTGTMLGVAGDPQLERAGVRLARGDALILYTDGVTDARAAGGERFGEGRLHAALRGAAGGSAETIAAAVDAAVRAHQQGAAPADDRAIVVLRVR